LLSTEAIALLADLAATFRISGRCRAAGILQLWGPIQQHRSAVLRDYGACVRGGISVRLRTQFRRRSYSASGMPYELRAGKLALSIVALDQEQEPERARSEAFVFSTLAQLHAAR
jgi:hypothetical protein